MDRCTEEFSRRFRGVIRALPDHSPEQARGARVPADALIDAPVRAFRFTTLPSARLSRGNGLLGDPGAQQYGKAMDRGLPPAWLLSPRAPATTARSVRTVVARFDGARRSSTPDGRTSLLARLTLWPLFATIW